MNYVESFDFFGIPAKQITCTPIEGAPTSSTEGAVGSMVMDVSSVNNDLYKCVSVDNEIYIWELVDLNQSNRFDDYNLPILEITGNDSALNKENYTEMNYIFGDMSGTCEMKWQGSSSLAYPKKNYTIKFDSKFLAVDTRKYYKGETELTKEEFDNQLDIQGASEAQRLCLEAGLSTKLADGIYYGIKGTAWSQQKKYCTKANYIENSHARNIVSARLWSEVVRSRLPKDVSTSNIPPIDCTLKVSAAPKAGAIDGFPIIIMMNGKFLGLYTFNIPKDGWMMNMTETAGTKQAIVCADGPETAACRFKGLATCVPDSNNVTDFEIEFTSDKTNFGTEPIRDSLNNLITAVCNCMDHGGDIAEIDQYLDWDSAIDYYIYTCLLGGMDGMVKNYLLATYDGVKWFFSAYDLDSTFGLYWDGTKPLDANTTDADFNTFARRHKLMELIKKYKWNSVVKRYNELRKGVMSIANVQYKFGDFIADIPKAVINEDIKRWHTLPGTEINNYNQIVAWYENRCKYLDEQVNGIRFDFPLQQDYIQNEEAYEFLDNLVINNEDWYKNYSLHHYGQYVSDTYNTVEGKPIIKVKTTNPLSNQTNSYILNDLNMGTSLRYGKEISRTTSKINVYTSLTDPAERKNVLICGDSTLPGALIEELENKFTSNNLTNYHLLKNVAHNNFKLVETAETTNGEVKYSCSNNVITVSNVDTTTPLSSKVQLTIKFTEAITSDCVATIVVENADNFTKEQTIPMKLVLTKDPWYEEGLPTIYPYWPDPINTSIEIGERTLDGFRFNCNAGNTFNNLKITVTVSSVTEGDTNYLGGDSYDWYTFVDSPATLPLNAPTNPFWNTTANILDFKNYIQTALAASGSTNGMLDYVICILGKEITHTLHKGDGDIDKALFYTRRDATRFINMVKTAYSDCKILLGTYVLPPNFYDYTDKTSTYYIHALNEIYADLASNNSNVRVCNVTSQVDPNNAYTSKLVTIGGVEYTVGDFKVTNGTVSYPLNDDGISEMAKSIWRGFTGLVNMN